MNSDLKIIVCCHKKDPNIREGECYIPLHVGKACVFCCYIPRILP